MKEYNKLRTLPKKNEFPDKGHKVGMMGETTDRSLFGSEGERKSLIALQMELAEEWDLMERCKRRILEGLDQSDMNKDRIKPKPVQTRSWTVALPEPSQTMVAGAMYSVFDLIGQGKKREALKSLTKVGGGEGQNSKPGIA